MTPERKKAVVVIVVTLIMGILIGVLSSGLWTRSHYGHGRGRGDWHEEGRKGFTTRILHLIEADSSQAEKIRPILNETIAHIDSLQHQTEREVRTVIDSLEIRLKPMLSPDQMDRLKKFHSRGKEIKKR